ncbi:MAG TPA: LPXTG cell wall anchor domain-containing protein [Mycobacteriales bacterium]|nr:LPXTG cell wall anchor domain-containing protein [Mycobacteriales bacterium]
MSVSAGTGGAAVVGALVGTGSGVKGASAIKALPYTGASHLMELVALGLVLLITGILMLGVIARVSDGDSS